MTDAEKLAKASEWLAAIHREFRATVRQMDNDGKGMQVRFCGDFAPSSLSPFVRACFRRWEQLLREVLDEIGVDTDGE